MPTCVCVATPLALLCLQFGVSAHACYGDSRRLKDAAADSGCSAGPTAR